MAARLIHKILVANRGEIAARVMRTCRRMGIATVAVYSDADRDMPFVRAADEAVHLGPAPAAESYLSIPAIIEAARRVEADAVHPGYGFLSENGEFAAACEAAGLVFIGPEAWVIKRLGSKRDAKAIAVAAGAPVVPGYAGDDQSTPVLVAKGTEIGFPLLIKASAGGGGKGMRVVTRADDLVDAIDSSRREAARGFADATLILERYIERPRHVEVQLLGDRHGHLVHLWERECSIQRRHQKVVEESPSTALDEKGREAICAAALAIGKAVSYSSAGTVEFIVGPDGQFYFLEVNTRLQVEHAVTEAITGLDLVEQQIRVARGEVLGFSQAPARRGHAIEVRLYAEDPERQHLPSTGRLVDWHLPERAGIRVDAGVETGSRISIHYDPMLAKIIAHGDSRDEARARLVRTLGEASVAGVTSNRDLLRRVLLHASFVAGDLDTHFLEHHADSLGAPQVDAGRLRRAAVVATVAGYTARAAHRALRGIEPGWRNLRGPGQEVIFTAGLHRLAITYRNLGGGRLRVESDGQELAVDIIAGAAPDVTCVINGHRTTARVVNDGHRWYVDGLVLVEEARHGSAAAAEIAGSLVAPMPGKVVRVLATPGQRVAAGATLLVLEAMKMEHAVKAAAEGVVGEVHVGVGDQVEADQLLAVVSPAGT